jgi:hypothetical protein
MIAYFRRSYCLPPPSIGESSRLYYISPTGLRRETDAVGEIKNNVGIIRRTRLRCMCFLAINYEG